jgi:cell division protein FtsB
VTAQGNEGDSFGRVDADGTVYVRIGAEERVVGQYPEGTPEEALAFYTKRYEGLAFEVQLLEQRVRGGAMSPDEATSSIARISEQLAEPHAVGDITSLVARLNSLKPVIGMQREQRRAERSAKVEESRARKNAIVAEAEKIAAGTDWRNGANRLRDLLAEWKELPRLEKSADDELWHRFSGARTTYTRARKAHFAVVSEQRDGARVIKERLAKEAEALAGSTDWGGTATTYRNLMSAWKAAGPAPKDVDDALWKRFRGAQDEFFGARDAANAELDQEFAANAEAKKAILLEAEALLPITDLAAAKKAFRDIAERWESAGKVPREQIKTLEARIRKVEQEIRGLEDDQWKKSDPEKSARADGMVGQLEGAIAKIEADLAKAQASGDARKVKDLEGNLESRRAFLEMAKKTASEFS